MTDRECNQPYTAMERVVDVATNLLIIVGAVALVMCVGYLYGRFV